jgi:hypothetical protein
VGVGDEPAQGGLLVGRQASVARGADYRVGLLGGRPLVGLGQRDLLLDRRVGRGVLVEPGGDLAVVEVAGEVGGAVEEVVERLSGARGRWVRGRRCAGCARTRGGAIGSAGGTAGDRLVDAAEVFAHE